MKTEKKVEIKKSPTQNNLATEFASLLDSGVVLDKKLAREVLNKILQR